MTAKDKVTVFLLSYHVAVACMQTARERYERTYADATTPAGQSIGDGMPHAHGRPRGLDDRSVAIADARTAFVRAYEDAKAARKQIEDALDRAGLTDTERDVIIRKYLTLRTLTHRTVDGERLDHYTLQPWGQIAADTGATYAAVTHTHGRALAKLMLLPEFAGEETP